MTLGLTMLEHHHLGVSHLGQVHAVAVTHLLWGRGGLHQGKKVQLDRLIDLVQLKGRGMGG